jgi:hypothetical protein
MRGREITSHPEDNRSWINASSVNFLKRLSRKTARKRDLMKKRPPHLRTTVVKGHLGSYLEGGARAVGEGVRFVRVVGNGPWVMG